MIYQNLYFQKISLQKLPQNLPLQIPGFGTSITGIAVGMKKNWLPQINLATQIKKLFVNIWYFFEGNHWVGWARLKKLHLGD
jgi:hypothetical protein